MPAELFSLPCGLTLAYERRRGPAFAFDLRVPLGSAHDPAGQEGVAGVVEEWLYKGAGERDARAFQEALDDLGVRRDGGVSAEATRFAASGLGSDLSETLGLYADLLRRAHLNAEELPTLLDLARQDVEGLSDNPDGRLGLEVRRLTYKASGFEHPSSGTLTGLRALSTASARAFYGRYGAAGGVLAVVADNDASEVQELVQRHFGDWHAGSGGPVTAQPQLGLRAHINERSQQTHFTLLGRGTDPHSSEWLSWHLALTALSSGSASRLFHAVREERGLAYSVNAGAQVVGNTALIIAHAASTPKRAPETLEVIVSELETWKRGLKADEFERAKTALIASTVFGAESIRARASGMTRDLALFGKLRDAAQLRAELQALTLDGVNRFLSTYDYGELSVISLGPSAPLAKALANTPQTSKAAHA